MNVVQRADMWNEVWAEYDARQARRLHNHSASVPVREARQPVWPPQAVDDTGAMGAERDLARPARSRPRPGVQVGIAALSGMMLLLAWLALPWMLAVRLSVPIGQGDAPGLMQHFDQRSAMASLRNGLAAEVPAMAGEGAQRFLSGMADRMAASWEQPEALRAWLALRARGGAGEGSPASLSTLRSARPTGLASFRLEYGPPRGDGGVAFDMAWQGSSFQVTGVHFLDAPAAPWPSTLVAMR